MFAQLYYPENTSPANVANDIQLALTGAASLSSFSAALDKTKSTLSTIVPATWEAQTVSTSRGDIANAGTVTTGGLKALRQPVSTASGVFKYLKFGFLVSSLSSTTHKLSLSSNIGKGISAGNLTETADTFETANTSFSASTNTAAALFSKAIKVTIHSSPSATLLAVGEDTFFEKMCFAVFDTENKFTDCDAGTYVPTALVRQTNPLVYGDIALQPVLYMLPYAKDGKVFYETTPNAAYGYVKGAFTVKGAVFDARTYHLISDAAYKFENFARAGTRYSLMPFGISQVEFRSTNTGPNDTNDQGRIGIPYSGITELSGVYLTNYYAFGHTGNFYETPQGTMCKFGNFMVGVQ